MRPRLASGALSLLCRATMTMERRSGSLWHSSAVSATRCAIPPPPHYRRGHPLPGGRPCRASLWRGEQSRLSHRVARRQQQPRHRWLYRHIARTLKRDYVRVNPTPDVRPVIEQLPHWQTHHNEVHPRKALGYASPRAYIIQPAMPRHATCHDDKSHLHQTCRYYHSYYIFPHL